MPAYSRAMAAQILAAIGLAVCLALLGRMALKPPQRRAFDAFWRARWHALQSAGRWTQRQWRLLRTRRGAQDEAARAIGRARGPRREVDRDGNVLRPRDFRPSDDERPPRH